MKHLVTWGVALVLLALGAAGCKKSDENTAPPQTTSPSATTTAVPAGGDTPQPAKMSRPPLRPIK